MRLFVWKLQSFLQDRHPRVPIPLPRVTTFFFSKKNSTTANIRIHLIHPSYINRRAITKPRTSNHTLAIEAGRWTTLKEKIDYVNNARENKIEDEIHFLFQCTKYTAERQKTFETIKTKTNIDLSNNETKIENLKLLFASGSLSSFNTLGKFIKDSFSKREL